MGVWGGRCWPVRSVVWCVFGAWWCVVSGSVVSPLVVSLVGSRGLPSVPASGGLVSLVVDSLLGRGFSLAVGCCSGADAAVLRAAGSWLGSLPSAPASPRLRVFAAFGPGGAGSWRSSAVPLVLRAAASPLARVSFWAGGDSGVGLVARLRARSVACVGPASGGCVAFVSGGLRVSGGSWGSLRVAVAAGFPVVVFPVRWSGFSVAALPSLGGGGSWVPASASGVWARGWAWVPFRSPSNWRDELVEQEDDDQSDPPWSLDEDRNEESDPPWSLEDEKEEKESE